jgi:hypothetical protein
LAGGAAVLIVTIVCSKVGVFAPTSVNVAVGSSGKAVSSNRVGVSLAGTAKSGVLVACAAGKGWVGKAPIVAMFGTVGNGGKTTPPGVRILPGKAVGKTNTSMGAGRKVGGRIWSGKNKILQMPHASNALPSATKMLSALAKDEPWFLVIQKILLDG